MKRTENIGCVAGEERDHLVDQLVIFLSRDVAGARGAALADVIQQARALTPRNHPRDILLTLANGILLAYERKTIAQE